MTPADVLDRIVETRGPGSSVRASEADGLDLLESLGIPVPHRVLVRDAAAAAALDLSAFPGDRVVVKVVSPAIAHKSDVGGVAVVLRETSAVSESVRAMADRFGSEAVEGFLVCAFVPHASDPGAQLLVAYRRTRDFGPVISIGLGGVHAETLAAAMRPEIALGVATADRGAAGLLEARAPATAVPLAVERQRGAPPRIERTCLARVLDSLAALADHDRDRRVAEIEINPLAAGPDGAVALDAVLTVQDSTPAEAAPRPIEKLTRLVEPRSIAVQGVSSRGDNPGRIILRNIVRAGFPADRIVVIKPGADAVDGVRCVPDLASMPWAAVDLLIVAVAAAQVGDVLEEVCRDRRAESLIVIPGGLGETSGSAARARSLRAALEAARATPWRGPVVNGGNCLGIRSRTGRYDTLFLPEPKLPPPATRPSPLAILSQSGAFGITAASRLGPAQPDLLVTFGNQTDLTLGDWIEHVEGRADLRVVACYLEGFRAGDGLRFLASARRIVAAGRTVILYRAGRTPEGAGAAASHTASIAGDWETTRTLAREAGVLFAETLGSFHDLVRTFALLDGREPRGAALGAMSNAGFECVAIADALGPLRLASFAPETAACLATLLRENRLEGIVDVRNPLDVTPILGNAGFAEAAAAILADPGVDVGLVGCVPLTGALDTLPSGDGHGEDLARDDAVATRIVRAFASTRKPCVAVVDAGAAYDPLAEHLTAGGVPTFRSADRALRALGTYVLSRRRATALD